MDSLVRGIAAMSFDIHRDEQPRDHNFGERGASKDFLRVPFSDLTNTSRGGWALDTISHRGLHYLELQQKLTNMIAQLHGLWKLFDAGEEGSRPCFLVLHERFCASGEAAGVSRNSFWRLLRPPQVLPALIRPADLLRLCLAKESKEASVTARDEVEPLKSECQPEEEILFSKDWAQVLSIKAGSIGSRRCFDRNGKELALIRTRDTSHLQIDTRVHEVPGPEQFPLKLYQELEASELEASVLELAYGALHSDHKLSERHHLPPENVCVKITEAEREQVVSWLVQVCTSMNFSKQILHSSIDLFDRYAAIWQRPLPKRSRDLQVTSLAVLSVTIKMRYGGMFPFLREALEHLGRPSRISAQEVFDMERKVVEDLNFEVSSPVAIDFLDVFVQMINKETDLVGSQLCEHLANFLLELSAYSMSTLHHSSGYAVLAAAALHLALWHQHGEKSARARSLLLEMLVATCMPPETIGAACLDEL